VQISLSDRDGMKFGNGHADSADRGGDGGGRGMLRTGHESARIGK
jgi:hypothetical protein